MAGHRRSLRLELVATLAILLMMAVVSLALVGEMLGQRRHYANARDQLSAHARGLATLVTPLVSAGPAATARTEVEQALRPSIGSLGIEAIEVHRFVDGTPQKILDLGLAPEVPPPALVDDAEGTSTVTDDGVVIVDRPLRTFGTAAQSPMQLRVMARPSAWTRLADWREIAVMTLGVGGLLLVLGVLLLELQVLRPLAHVRSAVGEVERGNLQARVPSEGPAELQGLAEAFNRMTGALQARVQEIEAQRARLVRAEQLASVGRIAAGVAHEVGNPLAALSGYVDLLLDPRTDPPLSSEQRTLLERSREQLARIQNIVGQLLDFTRPSSKTMQDVDAFAASQRLLSLMEHDKRCEGVTLRVEGETVIARADPALFDQVLQNLVVNGCRAAREGSDDPCVVVRVRTEGDRAVIEVQDDGSGVAKDVRPRLFEPFFTTAKAGEGTGLGLAISQGLVEQMDGALVCVGAGEIEPLSPDRCTGAVFRVTLPTAGSAASASRSNADRADAV